VEVNIASYIPENLCDCSEFICFLLLVYLQVTTLTGRHTCVSSMRMKTTAASQKWVASKAVSILRDSPNMGVTSAPRNAPRWLGSAPRYVSGR
jgi:hypothetical protein